jgi:hypothetical protein
MKKRIRGFAVSWLFAPYVGSADLDFYKRLKLVNGDFWVVQVQREKVDSGVLELPSAATFHRTEVLCDHRNPRTLETRKKFSEAAVALFRTRMLETDVLLSHSNEVPSHAVALECKRLAPHIPWVAYFGDVVRSNPYVRHMSSYPLHNQDCETETKTIELADIVICNNVHQRNLMFQGELERYRHKAVVIPHCFDPAMYGAPAERPSDRFSFMHVGTLYSVKRTASPLMRAVDRLIEIYPEYQDRFELVFYGGGYSADDLHTYAHLQNRNHVRLENSVPYLKSLALMQTADVLVNIDGLFSSAEDGLAVSPFFPGKLADYMGARKPIFAITMDKGATNDILRDTGNLMASDAVDRMAFVMKRYIDGKVKPRIDFDSYSISAVGPRMEQVLRTAMSGPLAIAQMHDGFPQRREVVPAGEQYSERRNRKAGG